jgi:hypothetical protein
MGEQKRKEQSKSEFIFGKKNYKFMFIGLLVIALGFILMAGGGSDDPNVWNDAVFNFRRLRIAPGLVIIGFGIQIYAILLDPNDSDN